MSATGALLAIKAVDAGHDDRRGNDAGKRCQYVLKGTRDHFLNGRHAFASEQGFSAVRNRLLGHLTTNPRSSCFRIQHSIVTQCRAEVVPSLHIVLKNFLNFNNNFLLSDYSSAEIMHFRRSGKCLVKITSNFSFGQPFAAKFLPLVCITQCTCEYASQKTPCYHDKKLL